MYQGQLSTTLTATLATVPSGKTWIVKEITVVNTDTAARAVTLRMPGSGAGAEILSAKSVAAGDTLQIRGHWVLSSTETITGGADVANKVSVHISGAEGP
jgi:hypothetical protein